MTKGRSEKGCGGDKGGSRLALGGRQKLVRGATQILLFDRHIPDDCTRREATVCDAERVLQSIPWSLAGAIVSVAPPPPAPLQLTQSEPPTAGTEGNKG